MDIDLSGYHPVNSENSYEGYGSYSLHLVNEWMGENFIKKEFGDIND